MTESYADPLQQGSGLVERSDVYPEQQVRSITVGLEPYHQGAPSFEQEGKPESAAVTQKPEQHVEELHMQGHGTANSEQYVQRRCEMTALEQQLQHYYSVEAMHQQRLFDLEASRSRLLQRFQLDRIVRFKEAAAKVEALNRRMQQHEADAAWRTQRNSYMRDEVIQMLHWKLTKKDVSDAVLQLRRQRNKFQQEVMRFLKADMPGVTPKPTSLLRAASAPLRKDCSTSATNRCAGALPSAASEEGSSTVTLESDSSARGTAQVTDPSTSFCTVGSVFVPGPREDMSVVLSSTTAKASATHVSARNNSFAPGSASADSKENADRKESANRKFHSHASAPQPTEYRSVNVFKPDSSFLSPRFSSYGRSPVSTSLTCSRGEVVPSSEHSSESTEPFHLQLLALRYKQEVAALEMQQVVPRRATPSPRHRTDCHVSAAQMNPECVTCSSSSVIGRGPSPSTANPLFGAGGSEQANASRFAEGPVSPETDQCITAHQPTNSHPVLASRLPGAGDVSSTSAGAVLPPQTYRCRSTRATIQDVCRSPDLRGATSAAGMEFPSSRPRGVCSAPITPPVVSYTSSPPKQPISLARHGPSCQRSLLPATETATTEIRARASFGKYAAGKHEDVATDAREDAFAWREGSGVDEASAGSSMLKGGTDPYAANTEAEAVARPHSAAADSRVSQGCAHPHQASQPSRPSESSSEDRMSVNNEGCHDWTSPDIPTEKPLSELHSCEVL